MYNPFIMQKQNSNRMKKKKRVGFMFFAIFIAMFGLLLIGAGYFVSKIYGDWRDGFEHVRLSTDFFYVGSEEYVEYGKSLDDKLGEFQESLEMTDFVELYPEEVLVLFNRTVFNKDNSDWEPIRYTYENEESTWVIYMEVMYKKRLMPWIVFKVHKDPIESPELYIEELSIGDFSLDSYGFGFIRDNMNIGYSDAINSINESGFTGRVWQNIELELDRMIIKGAKLEK